MSDSIKDTEARIAAMAAERELMRKELRDQNTARTPEIATLRARITALEAERDALREGLLFFGALVGESRGLAGFHLNGNIAEWSEFDPELSEVCLLLKEPRND